MMGRQIVRSALLPFKNLLGKYFTFAYMIKNGRLQTIREILLYVFAFSIPLPFIFSPYVIGAIILTWILAGNIKTVVHELSERKMFWPWLIFFLIYLISCFYSHDKSRSLFDIQQKLSFLILPLVIGCGVKINAKTLEGICLSFILSVAFIALLCIGRALIIWQHSHITNQFFYQSLVNKLDANAVYYAWYSVFAIATILFLPWKIFFLKNNRFYKYILLLIILLFFVLLSARTLLIVFFFIIIPLYLYKLTESKKGVLIRASILIVIGSLCFLIFTTSNPIKNRYVELVKNKQQNYVPRFVLWEIGIENINEHNLWFIGAGNGDYQAIHNEKINRHVAENKGATYNWADLYDANLHNTYLQTIATVGIVGLLPLLLMLFSPFLYIYRINMPYLYFIFNLLTCIFLFQECAFQTQAGIMFYVFFAIVFWNYYYTKGDNKYVNS